MEKSPQVARIQNLEVPCTEKQRLYFYQNIGREYYKEKVFPSIWTEQKVSKLQNPVLHLSQNIALIINKNFLRFQRRGEE